MNKLDILKESERTFTGDVKTRRSTVAFRSEDLDNDADKMTGRRPQSLRKTSDGGSTRLFALAGMLQTVSIDDDFSSRPASFARPSTESASGELDRLQYLLGKELPNTSRLSMPGFTADILMPRRTLIEIEEHLFAPLETYQELDADWEPTEIIRSHDFVREMAMKKLESDLFNKLRVIYNTHVANMKPSDVSSSPMNSPFGWTLEDFLRRRQVRNIGWLETLLLRPDKELLMLKFKSDIEELSKMLKLIFNGLRPTVNQVARPSIFAFVHDTHDFLKFPKAFQADAKRNMIKLREQVNTYLDMWYYKRGADEEAYKYSLQQKLMSNAVIGPIELRYQVNWLRTKTDQAVMKMTNVIEETEKKVENLKAQEAKESYCARCALDMYYLDIESFKRRINELSNKYEKEVETIENEIAYKRISMDKLRAQRKYLEEQMARFKEEIEQMRQKEREEQEREEQRKKLEEMKLLEEELARKKKKAQKQKDKKK